METFLVAGIPAMVICLLTGIVIFERHAGSVGARNRTEQLKQWLSSQSSAHMSVRDSVGRLR
jgi:hypothetical protein